MSALNLLSVIAPAVPVVPQGSVDDAASGFQSLLAALFGTRAGNEEATAAPSGKATPDDVTVEAAGDTPAAVPGFLIPPAPLPVPVPVKLTPAPATGDGSAEDLPATAIFGSAPDQAEVPETLPGNPDAGDTDGVTATTPLPVEKALTARTNDPQIQPAVEDVPGPVRPTSETHQALIQTAAVAEAAAARSRTEAPPQLVQPQGLPPLRPLAERTSRPLEAAADKSADAPRAADTARSAAPVPAAPAPAGEMPVKPVDIAGNLAREVAARGGEAEEPATDLPLPAETGSPQVQGPAATRDTVVSQLSRTTIDATAQIAAQILRRLEGRSTRFEMALMPEELGRVDVKLDIDAEGRLNARLAFDNPLAAIDLRGRADELRRQLEQAGFQLADDAFEFAERDTGSSAFDRGQDTRDGSTRAFAAAASRNADIDIAQPPSWMALSLSPSGVDLKV